nr:MAG TPA: hypothetical protein [Caudoviricetes sp.]
MLNIKFFQVFLCLIQKIVRNGRLFLARSPVYFYSS